MMTPPSTLLGFLALTIALFHAVRFLVGYQYLRKDEIRLTPRYNLFFAGRVIVWLILGIVHLWIGHNDLTADYGRALIRWSLLPLYTVEASYLLAELWQEKSK